MTIFSRVAKQFVVDALVEHINGSIEKDVPPPAFFSYIVPERDKELSSIKRDFLKGLQDKISTLHEYSNDLETTRAILFYLGDCKTQVENAATRRNRGTGTTEALLEHLIKFVKSFHIKATTLALTDQVDDQRAFSHFSIVIASYHARRIIDSKPPSYLFSPLSSVIAFQKRLDKMVNTTYTNSRRNLERQDQTDSEHYTRITAELGELCLEFLALKHEKMHAEYATCLYAPFLPYYLNDYLKHAQQITQSQTPAVFFTEELVDDDFTVYDSHLALDPQTDKADLMKIAEEVNHTKGFN